MNFAKGDDVFHPEEGRGVVVRIWPKQNLVTVKFEGSGSESWIVPSKELTHL